jgi:hypothetical protein
MAYEKGKIIEFLRIDTDWGWFVPIVLPFLSWYFIVNFLLVTEFGIVGRIISGSEIKTAVATIGQFRARAEKIDSRDKPLIFSLSEDRDGTSHHRITARLSDNNYTYKIKPWLWMSLPSLLVVPIGFVAVGVLGFEAGAQPRWLVNGLVLVNLVMLGGVVLWKIVA